MTDPLRMKKTPNSNEWDLRGDFEAPCFITWEQI